MRILRNTLTGLSSLCILLSCTPTFKTTEQLCQAYLPTTQATKSYVVNAQASNSEYQLYLEDFVNSFKDIQSKASDGSLSAPTSDEQAVIDFILLQIQNQMGYEITDGTVSSADNPLDYIESLIAATDSDLIVQTFVEAKSQMLAAINADNGHCTYSNDQILYIKEDDALTPINSFEAKLDISYVPSVFVEGDQSVDQAVLLTLDRDPDADAEDKVTYSSLDRIAKENFKAEGYSDASVRTVSIKEFGSPENFFVDDDFTETKLGTLAYSKLNERCTDDDGVASNCEAGLTVKAVEHARCEDGVDDDGEGFSNPDVDDESNTVQIHSFNIGDGSNSALQDLQRLKVEVDYPNNEIRVFVSKFSDAIYKAFDADGNDIPQGRIDNPTPSDDQLILNPTNCESYNVSLDLYDAENDISSPSTAYQDSGFDLIQVLDAEGEPVLVDGEDDVYQYIEPTPIFTFQGTAIISRQ
jgi:hypothetical protein